MRLVPLLGSRRSGRAAVEDVRRMSSTSPICRRREVAAKTVNNTLGTLVVCLNAAAEDGLSLRNPALRVSGSRPSTSSGSTSACRRSPLYLDSCADVYRPLAEVLIGSGMRISEALALRVSDLELERRAA